MKNEFIFQVTLICQEHVFEIKDLKKDVHLWELRNIIRVKVLVDDFDLFDSNNVRLRSKSEVKRGSTYRVVSKIKQEEVQDGIFFCNVYWHGSKKQLHDAFSIQFCKKYSKKFDMTTFKIQFITKLKAKKRCFQVKFCIHCKVAKLLLLNDYLWLNCKRCYIRNNE